MRWKEKLVRWLMFTVAFSMVPLASTYFGLRLDRREASLTAIVAHGELLLICTSVVAAALGELLPGNGENATAKLFAAGTSLLGVTLCSFYFAAIQSRAAPDPGTVAIVSVCLFAGMLAAGTGCLYLAHQEEK
jgi:cation transporter-like permease